MRMSGALLAFWFLSAGLPAEEPARPVIATIDGASIPPERFELELLSREGRVRLREILDGRLGSLDWSRLGEDEPVCLPLGAALIRREVADLLEREQGARVLDEMVKQRLVDEALVRAGVAAEPAVLEAEWRRRAKELDRRVRAASGNNAQADLASVVQTQRGQDKQQYLQDPAVQLEARLNAWIVNTTAVPDEILRKHLTLEAARWSEPEAVELSLVTMPYHTVEYDGQQHVDPEHRRTLPKTMATLHASLTKGSTDFAKLWRTLFSANDPHAVDGRVGWVDRAGLVIDHPGARQVPAEVVTAAFAAAANGALPQLLEPVTYAAGVDIARVEAYRQGRAVDFAAQRDALRRDWLEQHLAEIRDRRLAELVRQAGDPADARRILSGRPLRDELLRRAGRERALDLLEARYDLVDWAVLADVDTVLTLPRVAELAGVTIRRIDLLVDLLERQGAEVRTDLIRLHLVDRVLSEAGMAPDPRILDLEWQRWDETAKRAYSREELERDAAFRRAACLHEYVLRLVEVPEAQLKEWYLTQVPRFTVTEAVDLSVIRLAKRTLTLNGQPIPDEQGQALQRRLLGEAHQGLADRRAEFTAVWTRLGRAGDPYAPGGRIGWVQREGKPERTGPRPLPARLVDAACAASSRERLPCLLPVYEDDGLLAIVRVEAYRQLVPSDFMRQHDEIRRAWIEERLPQAVERVVNDLMRGADLVFGDLGEHLERRRADQLRLLQGIVQP